MLLYYYYLLFQYYSLAVTPENCIPSDVVRKSTFQQHNLFFKW